MARFFGIFLAITLHAGVLLFGGLLFLHADKDKGTLQEVDLLSADVPKDEKKEEKKEEPKPKDAEQIETEDEKPPDAAELLRNLDLNPLQAQPELEAASLSAIADALNGLGGSGDFSSALTFASGGAIGGTGKAGALDKSLESAFSLSEIDQAPRVVWQVTPSFPSEMHGKKIEGQVTVLFIVDANGKVTDPRIEKSSHPAFERPALDAVRQWKFEPAVKGGKRVPCKMRAPLRFQPS